MVRKSFLTGGVRLCVESDAPVADADFFPLFRTEDVPRPDFTVRIRRQPLPGIKGLEVLKTNHRRRVLADGAAYDFTSFSDSVRGTGIPYACAVRQGGDVTLYVDYDRPLWDTMVFDAIDVPDLFLETNAAVVHASFISVNDVGILFAGPKTQGKSTQARLWQEHRNAVVINGDRAAVRTDGNTLTAFGIPFCGSSRVCLNEKRQIRAIVFPHKGTESAVVPLAPIDAFKQLIGCLSYTETDPAMQEKALQTAERIATDIPCVSLVCRPDKTAVRALAEALSL